MAAMGRILLNRIKPQLPPQLTQVRASSFKSSPFLSDLQEQNPEHKAQYDKTQCPVEWSYVERTLPPLLIPIPTPKPTYSSGWKPVTADIRDLPYYIERNRNHMMPVYLEVSRLGIRRITKLARIRGDIWKLHDELEAFLQKHQVRPIRSQVNELIGSIKFYGDWVNAIKHLLTKKGF